MNWKKLSTSTKLQASFGLMALLIGVAGWQGIASLANLNNDVNVLYRVHALGLAGLKTAQIELHKSIFDLQRAIQLKDTAQVAAKAEEIQASRNRFEKEVAAFQNTAVLEASRKKANDILNNFQTLNAEQDAILSMILARNYDQARKATIEVQTKGEKMLEQLVDLEKTKHDLMQAAAKKAETTYTKARTVLFIAVLAAVSLAFALGVFLTRQITKPLKRTVEVLQAVAQGDFTRQMISESDDEIGKMANALNQAIDGVRTALEEVNQSAVSVSDAAKELAKSSDNLSKGAHDQAASLDESAASLEEMTSTVRQNAENARQAAKQAQSARDNAENGGQVVTEAVAAMSEISLASKRIADIITTIDEIAFQTNLLALNAAVEAARAGEQGRGFAVVAAEVRNLAQRSATAAREIKTLIQDSLQKVDNGSSLVNRSGKTLQEIVTSVKRVTDIVAEIAAATEEQATGIDQVNRAVVQMDKITQGNAANTEKLTGTAQSLSTNAHHLRDLVGRFRLDNGGAQLAPPQRNRPVRTQRERPAPESQESEFVDFT